MESGGGSITLVQYPGLTKSTTLSPMCGKVHMALAFKGVEYAVRNVGTPGQARRYNPRGRVPTLLIDGKAVVDSSDILDELERRFPDPPLEPAERGARAAVRVLEDWADEVLYFHGVYLRWAVPAGFARMRREVLSRLPVPLRWIVPTIARREVRRRLAGQGTGLKDEPTVRAEFAGCLEALEGLLEAGPFLVGDRPSRADLSVAAVLDQLRVERLTPETAAEIGGRPALVAWLARVHERLPDASRDTGR